MARLKLGFNPVKPYLMGSFGVVWGGIYDFSTLLECFLYINYFFIKRSSLALKLCKLRVNPPASEASRGVYCVCKIYCVLKLIHLN